MERFQNQAWLMSKAEKHTISDESRQGRTIGKDKRNCRRLRQIKAEEWHDGSEEQTDDVHQTKEKYKVIYENTSRNIMTQTQEGRQVEV